MSNKIKDVDMKNYIYYFFSNIINAKFFDPNKIKSHTKIFTILDM